MAVAFAWALSQDRMLVLAEASTEAEINVFR